MIMPAGRPLLLPANPKFIALSFLLALLMHMLLGLLGWYWVPDVLAVVMVFWTVHQPRRVGLILAFCWAWRSMCMNRPCWGKTLCRMWCSLAWRHWRSVVYCGFLCVSRLCKFCRSFWRLR